MRKYVYVVVAGAALLVMAGTSWLVEKMRRPFVRRARRPERIGVASARYAPPEAVVRRRPSRSADGARRQFTVWG